MTDLEITLLCRAFVTEQSEGEWDDKTINSDADRMAEMIKSMIARALEKGEAANG